MPKHKIFDNNTTAGKLLNQKDIGLRFIARAAGVSPNMAKRALSTEEFLKCLPPQLRAVRQAVEDLLTAFHWKGNTSELWTEFDIIERQQLEKEDAA